MKDNRALTGITLILIATIAFAWAIIAMSNKLSDEDDARAENRDNPVNVEAIQRSLEK